MVLRKAVVTPQLRSKYYAVSITISIHVHISANISPGSGRLTRNTLQPCAFIQSRTAFCFSRPFTSHAASPLCSRPLLRSRIPFFLNLGSKLPHNSQSYFSLFQTNTLNPCVKNGGSCLKSRLHKILIIILTELFSPRVKHGAWSIDSTT